MSKGIVCITIMLFSFNLSNAQNLYTTSKSLEFADYLYQIQEYKLAEKEYQRLFFAVPDDSVVISRYFLCNYYLENYNKAEDVYTQYILSKPNTNYTATEVYLRSMVLLQNPKLPYTLSTTSGKNTTFHAITYNMLNSDWETAYDLYQNEDSDARVHQYESIFTKQQKLKYKKPGVAVALSVVIPGAGKAYSGYWRDAIFSFMFVSLSSWQAYRGFEQKGSESVYGWIYAGVGGGFYIGNIFGSAKAANKRNYHLNHELHHQVRHTYTHTPIQ